MGQARANQMNGKARGPMPPVEPERKVFDIAQLGDAPSPLLQAEALYVDIPDLFTLVYHALTDDEISMVRGKARDAETGDINADLYAKGILRLAWDGLIYQGQRYDLETEPMRVSIPTPDRTGILWVASEKYIEKVPPIWRIFAANQMRENSTLSEEQVARLLFTSASQEGEAPSNDAPATGDSAKTAESTETAEAGSQPSISEESPSP